MLNTLIHSGYKYKRFVALAVVISLFAICILTSSLRWWAVDTVRDKPPIIWETGAIFPSPTLRSCDVDKFFIRTFQDEKFVEKATEVHLETNERISVYAFVSSNCEKGITFEWQVRFGKIERKSGNWIVYTARADSGADSIRVNIFEENKLIGTGQFSPTVP